MSFKKILVPTDGSEFTKEAVNKAIELAKCTGGKITALYVVDMTPFMNASLDTSTSSLYNTLRSEGNAAVDYVKELGAKDGIEVDGIVAEGGPVRSILEASKDFDIIVMGTLGRTGISKILVGSVSERVIRHSIIPVMVVRTPEVDNK